MAYKNKYDRLAEAQQKEFEGRVREQKRKVERLKREYKRKKAAAKKAEEREARRQEIAAEKAQQRMWRASTRVRIPQYVDRAAEQRKLDTLNLYLELLLHAHCHVSDPCRWSEIANEPVPTPPPIDRSRSTSARLRLQQYKGSWLDRLMRRVDAKRLQLEDRLNEALELESERSEKPMQEYSQALEQWERQQRLAARMLEQDPQAFPECIETLKPMMVPAEPHATLRPMFPRSGICSIDLVLDSRMVPRQSMHSLKSGRMSLRDLSATSIADLIAQHFCSASLRIAREILVQLPIETVVVNTYDSASVADLSHGFGSPRFAAILTRSASDGINWAVLDSTELISELPHRIARHRTEGLLPIEPLTIADI